MWAGSQRTSWSRTWTTPLVDELGRHGGHGKGLRRTHGDAAGEKLGTSPVERSSVNVGTTSGSPSPSIVQIDGGQARCQPIVLRWGGVLVVSRRPGKLATGRRRTACSQFWNWNVRRSPVNIGAPWPDAKTAWRRVVKIQTKLHQWTTKDPGRQFDDLWNLVCDSAILVEAWHRVRSSRGARTAGVDGEIAHYVTAVRGEQAFLSELRDQLKTRRFQPLPVRQVTIPKPGSTKRRRLGIGMMTSY